MSKPRSCPHCQHTLPASSGYTFDHDMNIRCSKCGKVVFPATAAAETELLNSCQRIHQTSWADTDAEDQY